MNRSALDRALSLYPGWWRERYGGEMRVLVDDLLAEGRPAFILFANLLRGAVGARMHATGMPPVRSLWEARTRHLLALAALPWVLLWPLTGTVTGGDVVTVRSPYGRVLPTIVTAFGANQMELWRANGHQVPIALPTAAVVASYAGLALAVTFTVAALVVAAGWSRLWRGVRRASGTPRHLAVAAFVPALTLLLVVVLWLIRALVSPHDWVSKSGQPPMPIGGHPALAHLLGDVLGPTFIAGLVLSVACVALVSHRVPIPRNELASGMSIARWLSALTIVALVVYVVWCTSLLLGSTGNGAYLVSAFSPKLDLWPLVVPVLLVVAAVTTGASAGARRAFTVAATG